MAIVQADATDGCGLLKEVTTIRRPHISELPRWLQPTARAVRRVVAPDTPYPFEADGIATRHFSPFLEDAEFTGRYHQVAATFNGPDVRWRLWILTRCAQLGAHLDGSFAEFGTYRGGCAFMVLSLAPPKRGKQFFLFDTFAGIPGANLTVAEREAGFEGRLADVSFADVQDRLSPWKDTAVCVRGDVFDTLPATETGPLSFAHIDLNAAKPTELALQYAWSRMQPGGIVVFDDYGWGGYLDQRKLIDDFFGGPGRVIALPTGQALAIKV